MRPAGWRRGLCSLRAPGAAWAQHRDLSGACARDTRGQHLPAAPCCLLLPPGHGKSCVAWTCPEELPRPLQIQALTMALFLSLPVLQNMADDPSPAISCLALQTLYIVLGVQSTPSSPLQQLRHQFRRLWKSRPSLFRSGRLSCWSALES